MRDPFEVLFQAKERGLTLEALVGGLDFPGNVPTWVLTFPDLDGVKGLVPASEAGVPKELMPRFVGQEIRVKVKGIDRENSLAACSAREAMAEAAERMLPRLAGNPERAWEATVRCVVPGKDGGPPKLLVDIGGVLAEVPASQARVWLTKPLGQQYAPGMRVAVKVTRADPQTGLVEASVRKALPDPWERADFRRGQFVSGTVARTDGARHVWVEPDLCPGVLGLVPYPLVGDVRRGDRVSCAVASFDRAKKKLRLRLRGRLA